MEPIKSHSLPQIASPLFVGQESITTYQRCGVNSCQNIRDIKQRSCSSPMCNAKTVCGGGKVKNMDKQLTNFIILVINMNGTILTMISVLKNQELFSICFRYYFDIFCRCFPMFFFDFFSIKSQFYILSYSLC